MIGNDGKGMMDRILLIDNSMCFYQSPIGILKISETDGRITGLCLCREEAVGINADIGSVTAAVSPGCQLLREACRQLDEYFAGTRRQFDLPVSYQGTPFQKKVWGELRKIPYGETRSYEDIAISAGSPRAVRAVGQANHNNPLLILIPCHRVIHKNGDISGFACGIEAKKYLLALEKGESPAARP